MQSIVLHRIEKKNNSIRYCFDVSFGVKQFFSEKPFVIEYPENIESVPDAVAVVPFVCNVLPIVWLTDSKLIIPELDEAFYNCIPEVKKGYENMYPETQFRGQIEVGKVVPCARKPLPGNCAMFYSGGVDSMATLYRHIDEKPSLISIWGSDIQYDNDDGWKRLHTAIAETAVHFSFDDYVIHSTFREFDSEHELTKAYSAQLHDGWWHGVKHGIGLLGHVAPYAYLHGLEKMYIASSFCSDDKDIRCASDPRIDNNVRFASCYIVHDGFEWNRQDKIHYILEHSKRRNDYLPMHVCWRTQTGTNCCHCEKCYRTIVAILVEGEDPEKYGFLDFHKQLSDMQEIVLSQINGNLGSLWTGIQTVTQANRGTIEHSPYWKSIRWIEKVDFSDLESIKLPLRVRLKKAHGLRAKLGEFKFYQKLHDWKEKLK